MKYLTEEILNKYIDNELSKEESKMVAKILKNSYTDKSKYLELMKVEDGLKKMMPKNVSDGFTQNFMERLRLKSIRDKKQKRFVIFISSLLVTLIVAFTGTLFFNIFSKNISESKDVSLFKNISIDTSFLTENFSRVFSNSNLSIIGLSLSLVVLITLYFLLEEIKKTRHRLNKIQ